MDLQIDEAVNGDVAVKMYQKSMLKKCKLKNCEGYYRLILMDLGMPMKDGFEASKDIIELQNDLILGMNE